jgi:glycosyltransferase involved in cell wall biosynthesis
MLNINTDMNGKGVVFVQPFSLHAHAGGARIMRSLLKDAPVPWVSIFTSPLLSLNAEEEEIHLPIRPSFGRIENTRVAKFLYFFEVLFSLKFKYKLFNLCKQINPVAMHGIAHGMDFWFAYEVAKKLKIPFYLSIHDDIKGIYKGKPGFNKAISRAGVAWREAKECFVISREMGEEYSIRYGRRDYRIVTDGVSFVPDAPVSRPANRLKVYFMGVTHFGYRKNFDALIAALNKVKVLKPEYQISFTCRGKFIGSSVNGVSVEILPWAGDEVITNDIQQADVLYLPLSFQKEYDLLAKYSLPTKMVTYLASGIPILFHGPEDTAVFRLLKDNQAGIIVDSLDTDRIVKALLEAKTASEKVVISALNKAREEFLISDVRDRFWSAFKPYLLSATN